MTLVVVTAGKGSPGATSTAAALAAAAVDLGSDTVLIEFDPAGGNLALDAQLPLDPGLLSLAAAGRRGIDPHLIDAHSQLLPNGVRVLLAPTPPERAQRVAETLAAPLAAAARTLDRLVVVDCGRWSDDGLLTPLLAAADHMVVVLRPTVAGVEHVRTRLGSLTQRQAAVHLVAIGETPYRAREVAAALRHDGIYVMAADARTAELVRAGIRVDRWLRRTPLLRSARAVITGIDGPQSEEVPA